MERTGLWLKMSAWDARLDIHPSLSTSAIFSKFLPLSSSTESKNRGVSKRLTDFATSGDEVFRTSDLFRETATPTFAVPS